ncbi:type I secretion protein [Rhodophyticola porphyridii]|uniref:Type I secretion protein n=2 Tax=Rhodophyticola porphyridii TaxID=1852017 RepID=A0A3L9Y5G0_9RHOB|nr:type I secretion protein [Rhodophyticola porphyridii]
MSLSRRVVGQDDWQPNQEGRSPAYLGEYRVNEVVMPNSNSVASFEQVRAVKDADHRVPQELIASNTPVIQPCRVSQVDETLPCFTPGTVIATLRGEVSVEELRVGDRAITRDNGLQEICWTGAKQIDGRTLLSVPKLQPVMIHQGALGNGLPARDMMVSPNHRVLCHSTRAAMHFGDHEVLAAAKDLIDVVPGVQRVTAARATYIHFMFAQHEVVLSNGAWTESFQPNERTLHGIEAEQRAEIFALFPELAETKGRDAYGAARQTLNSDEARLLSD